MLLAALRTYKPFLPPLTKRMMAHSAAPLLLGPGQVFSLLADKKVSLLDASWFMPNSPRQPHQEFLSRRIPGAQFLDLDRVASAHELGLKHMMPQERVFADACESMGINADSHVIIYDTHGIFSSPRALFMFRSFGHAQSSVLNGGLPAWLKHGYPTEGGTTSRVAPTKYPTPALKSESVKSYDQIVANSILDPNENAEAVLDARSQGRFSGVEPEPRSGLPSGHIPNSLSLPFDRFLQKHSGPDGMHYTAFLPEEDIRKALEESVGSDLTYRILHHAWPVTTSCGSGMTACILWLGLKLLGAERISLYDESWTGYAMRPESTIRSR